jgi:hypothetical protein
MAFTEDEIWRCDLVVAQVSKARAKAAEMASARVAQYFEWNRDSNSKFMESPLEVVFLVWWYTLTTDMGRSGEDYDWWLTAQEPVEVNGRTYRLDFRLWPVSDRTVDAISGVRNAGVKIANLAVELDGHDFHEKTKEQVTYRNVRDRDLQMAGWQVFHISGSELVRDPERAVRHVLEGCAQIHRQAEEAFNSLNGVRPPRK